MIFNPMIDYGIGDMNDDKNIALWNFGELVKTLITISSDAKRQCEIIGIGAVADEMALDYESYYSLWANLFLEYGLINESQKNKLDELDLFFGIRSGKACPEFWDDDNLETNEDWRIARKKAKEALIDLGYDNLTIEFERKEKFDYSLFKKELVSQWTKTRLVKKNDR